MSKTMIAVKETNKAVKGSYAEVNGINLYHEISGAGKPLILLHGGVGASDLKDRNGGAVADNPGE